MNDRDIESMLTDAFGSRHSSATATSSLVDVRHRARRRHRRTMTAGVGALAITGVGGLVAIAQRDPASPSRPAAGPVPTSTCVAAPTTTVGGTVPDWTTTLTPPDTGPTEGTTPGMVSEATSATSTTVDDSYDPGCTPAPMVDGFRCVGEGATGADGWTYYSYCEPAGVYPLTTTIVPGDYPTTTVAYFTEWVLIVDASGDPTAVDEVVARLGGANVDVVQATRSVEQTMVMPTGSDLDIAYSVVGWLGVDGFDTWDASLIPQGTLGDDIAVVVVIGRDWQATTRPDQVSPTTPTTSNEAVAP